MYKYIYVYMIVHHRIRRGRVGAHNQNNPLEYYTQLKEECVCVCVLVGGWKVYMMVLIDSIHSRKADALGNVTRYWV